MLQDARTPEEKVRALPLGKGLASARVHGIRRLLRSHLDRFAWTLQETTATTATTHEVDTGSHPPIRQRGRRFSPKEHEVAEREVADLLWSGLIRKSNSPWAAPVVLVPKPDGRLRFCIDYRRLNAVTRRDEYPIPRVDEALDQLSSARWFSSLDLKAGYWQVPLSKDAAAKSAFRVRSGLYEWTRMPMGMCNSGNTFQRLVDSILGDLLWNGVLVYIDDIIVYATTFNEHSRLLTEVLRRLKAANMKISPTKSVFGTQCVEYLGHEVSRGRVAPLQRHLTAITKLVPPTSVAEIRHFLGLVGFYRRFVPHFASIAKPLYDLLKKDTPWTWPTAAQRAFETLRRALTTRPVLTLPDFSRPFILATDWSSQAGAAILSQKFPQGERVVAYASIAMKGSQQHWSSVEGECYTVLWAIEKFRPYLHGTRFEVKTDHRALMWLLTAKNLGSKLLRWSLRLQEYDFTVTYQPGAKHRHLDALSRLQRQL